ncbi:Bacterial membrane flanked domain protein [Rubripirellula lacrimiformis]|uniref:Bacterial membrane flanked domain protein n=1 Tax=Rubripirellula lacrimiformis TaxID=1930273 RepID=A0A517N767_9BACT|nr:PH domain-containing protein [Rubripirellula lacrimiformis]QDT02838.1 Bacterial membrane flanked domain protein [Rubripirellula lacrimiformis]
MTDPTSGAGQDPPSDPNPTPRPNTTPRPIDGAGHKPSFDQPRRLHPLSILFQLLSMSRQSLFPAIVAGWSAVNGSFFAALIVAAIFGLAITFAMIRYLTFRYQITDGELIVTEGILFRKVRNIPVDRIQNVDLVQSPFHRIFRVAEVHVETASGTEPEAKMRVLSLADVDFLKQQISSRGYSVSATTEADHPADTTIDRESREPQSQTILTIPVSHLIQAGLASNRGLILVSVALGFFFQSSQDLDPEYTALDRWIPAQVWNGTPWLLIPVAALALLVVIRLLGTAWYVLRFYGYRLERTGEDFQVSCGLLTKISATVPRRRIQFISVHRPPLMRWMRLASIRIETAGGAGKKGEDAATTITRRWFIPVIHESQVTGLLSQIRTGIPDDGLISWTRAAPRAVRRTTRIAVIASILIGIGTTWAIGWGGIAIGLVAAVLLITHSRCYVRSLGYYRFDNGVMFRSGLLNQKTSTTFHNRIQSVELRSSFFDRRWSMAKLSVDTAAAGPANHTITFPMMDASIAVGEFEALSKRSAAAAMNWD